MGLGELVDGLGPKHILLTFAAGIVAGVVIVLVDQFLVQKLETTIGITPGAA